MPNRCIVVDDALTTLAAAYTHGVSTTLQVAAGQGSLFGAPSASHPIRVTCIKASAISPTGQLTDRTRYATYRATTLSGDVLSGLSLESGTDQDFAVGDVIGALVDAQAITDLDADLATAEASISTNTAAIATKAADSAVVHLAGTEIVSGAKTFTASAIPFTHQVIVGASVAGSENAQVESHAATASTDIFAGYASSGALAFRVDPAGNFLVGNYTPTSTATPQNFSLGATYSPTAGSGVKFRVYDDGGTVLYGFGISAQSLDYMVPTGARHSWYMQGAEEMRLDSTGGLTLQKSIGLNGSTPPARPTITGSRGGNAALASLLTALAGYGLLTDGTTA